MAGGECSEENIAVRVHLSNEVDKKWKKQNKQKICKNAPKIGEVHTRRGRMARHDWEKNTPERCERIRRIATNLNGTVLILYKPRVRVEFGLQ